MPDESPISMFWGLPVRVMTLPMFAAMEDSDVDRVVNAVRQLCIQHQ